MTFLFASRRAFAASATRTVTRSFTTTATFHADKPPFAFNRGPAPPQLPKEEQDIFENLQKESTGAFSTPKVNQSPASENKSEGLHPDARMGPRPEFEGEKNPKTGEVGGPKNEPLRWGAEGDWSYSGRVTDF